MVQEVIHGAVAPVAVVPIAGVEVTVVRTTTVAAVTTGVTVPVIGTVEAAAMVIPGHRVTIRDGTPGKMIVRGVATSEMIPTNRIPEIVVPRIVSGPVRIIPHRVVVAEITAAEAVAENITVGMVVEQVVAVAHPAGTMMVAAHPTTNVALNIIHRRLAAVAAAAVAVVVALAVIGWIIAAAAEDAVAVIDPENRWGRQGRLYHGTQEAVDHRWVDHRWVRAIRFLCRQFVGDRLEVGLLVVSGTMDAAG